MTLEQYLDGLSVTTNAGGSASLRYSFIQGRYLFSGGVASDPPDDAPYASVRYGLARPTSRFHSGDVISDRRIHIQVHQFPDPATGAAPDIGNAIKLYRELLKADATVTDGENQASMVGKLILDAWIEPQETPDSRKLLGQITWIQKIQFFGI
jgi:hypothetical protein